MKEQHSVTCIILGGSDHSDGVRASNRQLTGQVYICPFVTVRNQEMKNNGTVPVRVVSENDKRQEQLFLSKLYIFFLPKKKKKTAKSYLLRTHVMISLIFVGRHCSCESLTQPHDKQNK